MGHEATGMFLIPPFPPGEVVNHFIMRMHRYTADASLSLAYRRLLKRKAGLDGMPSGLKVFHQEIGYLYGDVDQLIDQHTEFNFFCCGLPLEKFERQRQRLLETSNGPVRLCRLPLLFGETVGSYRYCPDCQTSQMREYGFTFVHRLNGVPFVSVCPIHSLPLRVAGEQGLIFDSYCFDEQNAYQRSMAWEYSLRVGRCLEYPAIESGYHINDVLQLLADAGWVRERGRIYLAPLIEAFSSFYSKAFSDVRLDLLTQSPNYIECAVRSLVRSGRGIHPTWCVLLGWFAQCCEYRVRKIDKTRRTRESKDLSKDAICETLAVHRTVGAASKALDIDPARLAFLCKRYGIDCRWRPKKLDESLVTRVREALEKGDKPNAVTAQFGLSLGTVYRILASLPEIHARNRRPPKPRIGDAMAEWLAIRSLFPHATTTDLRRRCQAAWTYLKRNAPGWLSANPGCQSSTRSRAARGTPSRLQQALDQSIGTVAAQCYSLGTVPMRLSRYRVQKDVGIGDYGMNKCVSRSVLNSEPRRDFVVRRTNWAYESMGMRGFKLTTFARLARLRTSAVSDVISMLHRK